MTKTEKHLISQLLEAASDEYTTHGCNDLILENTPGNRKVVEEMAEWADPEEPVPVHIHNGDIITYDWLLMRYLAERIVEDD
jgi:hypothetical protein